MLNIDKLRHNWEKPFLELMEGMERKIHPDNPHKTLWYKEDGWYFEQDEEIGYLLCQYNRVWSVLRKNMVVTMLISNQLSKPNGKNITI